VVITSKSNAIAKQIRALRQRKEREATGLFLVEGIKHVGEALEACEAGLPYHQVEFLCYAPELLTSAWARGLIQKQTEKGTPCHAFSREVFESLAEKENPQGLLAVARCNPIRLEDLSPSNFAWGIALVQPQDPGNIGAILRTVDAVGAGGLLLLDSSADPTHPGAVRASMGALFWHPVAGATFSGFTRWAQKHAYTLVGTSARGSVDYRALESYTLPLVLVMGSEREGLSAEQAAACRQVVRLPMYGRVTSLNLAVAAGVMMYEVEAKLRGREK
jgi:TrmH family RNA methyltransferase